MSAAPLTAFIADRIRLFDGVLSHRRRQTLANRLLIHVQAKLACPEERIPQEAVAAERRRGRSRPLAAATTIVLALLHLALRGAVVVSSALG